MAVGFSTATNPKAKHVTKATTTKAATKKSNGKAHTRFNPAHKIHLLVEGNPKRKDSKEAKRFAKYKNGMLVQAALDAGMQQQNLRRDVERKVIRIGG